MEPYITEEMAGKTAMVLDSDGEFTADHDGLKAAKSSESGWGPDYRSRQDLDFCEATRNAASQPSRSQTYDSSIDFGEPSRLHQNDSTTLRLLPRYGTRAILADGWNVVSRLERAALPIG